MDVLELERRERKAEDFLVEAIAKDGGCTPATLAWLLKTWRIPDDAKLPVGYAVDQVVAFKDELAERMAIAAHPRSG